MGSSPEFSQESYNSRNGLSFSLEGALQEESVTEETMRSLISLIKVINTQLAIAKLCLYTWETGGYNKHS